MSISKFFTYVNRPSIPFFESALTNNKKKLKSIYSYKKQ